MNYTEFGIEEGNNLNELYSDSIPYTTFNSFNSFKSLSKTKTNFTRYKNFTENAENNTFSNLNKESEKIDNKKDNTNIRKESKKK